MIFAVLFSSCAVRNDITDETEAMPETANTEMTSTALIESSSVPDRSAEAVSTEETSETTSEQELSSADVSEEISVTIVSVPSYDMSPVLTVSNIDYSSNRLEWTSVEGAQSYELYLLNEQSGEFEEYGEIKGTVCNDKKLLPGTKYTYAVAAKFSDGLTGKMSEAVSIYTYSLFATNTQGDWVYESEYDESKGARILRRNIVDGSVEDMTGYSFFTANDICVNGKYIFFIEDFLIYSGRIIRINIADKSMKVLREYVSDDGFGCYGIEEMAVYDNTIFYTTYGSWSEMDEPSYDLSTMDLDGNTVSVGAGYKESYSPIYFLNDENNFYIVWRDEDIVEIETEDEYYLRGVYTDKCYVYDAAARKTITVLVPAETSDNRYDFLEYDGGFLYIDIKDRHAGNLIGKIRAGVEGYEYID